MSGRLAWNNGRILVRTGRGGPKAQKAISGIREKLTSGEYSLEAVSCFCRSEEDMLISEIDRYGFYYPMVICTRCGLMRTNPRMTKESYAHFYSYEFRDAYGEGDEQIDGLFKQRISQGITKYEYFINSIDLVPRAVIFEIGCDFGAMLLPFAEHGCDVYGCDLGIEHIEYGRLKSGLKNLFIGGPEKLLEMDKRADLIILHHTLEHFLDLEGTLVQIRGLLKPAGICYLAVPGTYGRIKNRFRGSNNVLGLLQNAHTYQFNLATLRYVMVEFIKGNEEIEAFFKCSNRYRKKTDYPEKGSKNIIAYLRGAERKFLIKQNIVKCLDIIGARNVLRKLFFKRGSY